MNIKLKALLLTAALLSGLFGITYLVVYYPAALALGLLAIVFYGIYNIILIELTKTSRKKNGYTIKEFNDEFGGTK